MPRAALAAALSPAASRPRCSAGVLARVARPAALVAGLLMAAGIAAASQPALLPTLALDGLPPPTAPPPERGPVVPAQVAGWREEAKALEFGDGMPRDPVRAAELYCRAARYGDAESQYSLAWMLTHARGVERDEAQAAHLFAAAAEQGYEQARNILARMGTPRGAPPDCLRPPADDRIAAALPPPKPLPIRGGAPLLLPPPPPPPNAPEPIVRFVNLVAPEYQLQPHLVLAIMATESNFDAGAESPKKAYGLMQLIPGTAARFGVRDIKDPVQNIRGGMAYLRWLMAYFEGDVRLVAAAYNAGERAVERYLGVPPYAETRLYVLRILAAVGGQATHPFDAAVTPRSQQLVLMRPAWRPR